LNFDKKEIYCKIDFYKPLFFWDKIYVTKKKDKDPLLFMYIVIGKEQAGAELCQDQAQLG
jgi:hypothetical protein